MKQLITIFLLLQGPLTLSAQTKGPSHVCNISFYCDCAVRDSLAYELYQAREDSARATYQYMHSRSINGNNTSGPEPADKRSNYHLKNGSFYLED